MSIIFGEHIRLRAIEREDVKKFFEWVNDPEVTFGLSLYLPMSMTDEERWFESLASRAPTGRRAGRAADGPGRHGSGRRGDAGRRRAC